MANNVDLSTGFGSRVNIGQDPDWWMHGYTPQSGAPASPNMGAHPGNGPFGLIPAPLGDISDIAYNDLVKRLPGLSAMTGQAGGNVLSKLRGQLSPETQAAIQDQSAKFGLLSGMPGGQLNRFRTARDLGRSTEDLQSQGLQELGGLTNIGRSMNVSPETQIAARTRDLDLAAAPDPAAQASYAKSLFDQYLNSLSRSNRSPAGRGGGNDFGNLFGNTQSPQGGTGRYSAPNLPQGGGAGTGFASSSSPFPDFYDPMLSDENQFNALFPGEPYGTDQQLPAMNFDDYGFDPFAFDDQSYYA